MSDSGHAEHTLTLEQLSDLREKTEAISQLLQQHLRGYIETLRPLLLPVKVLGRYATSSIKEDIGGADKAFAQLRQGYKEACGKPFSLQPDLDEAPVGLIENHIELYPWEYTHDAAGQKDRRALTITSPIRWVLTYRCSYSLAQMLQLETSKGERHLDTVRQFLVNALAMNLLLAKYPGLTQLLTDLRFAVRTEKHPGLGQLPVTTVSACVQSFRPADDLILAATRLSGVHAFIELIDVESVEHLVDPIKQRIEEMLR